MLTRVNKIFFLMAALCCSIFALNFANVRSEEEVQASKNVTSVPPPGVEPFDPKIPMAQMIARVKSDKFRFAVLGDAKHANTLPALLKYVDETINPDFVLTTGDMVSSGAGAIGPGYYEMLSTEAGAQMRKRAWWPAIGNHEIRGGPIIPRSAAKTEEQIRANQAMGIENFKKFYHLDNDYYSFTFRNCAFIALPFKYPVGSQITWLEGELKKATDAKQHIFIFNHAPFFTVGLKPPAEVPNTETDVTALFQKYHVNAVFSGHDHGYYRTVRSGIPYFISAGGGAQIYPGTRLKEALPEDVYYNAVAASYEKGAKFPQFMLHKNDGSPDKISTVPDQFICVIDVDGDKINCFTSTAKGEKWDEMMLSK